MGRDEEAEPYLAPSGPPPRTLRELVQAVQERRGWARRLEGARVFEHWPAIAGEQLARHVQPVRLSGGVLVVRATSTVWATQVRYLAGELAGRANAVLGAGSVRQVRVVAGSDAETAR